MLMNIIIIIINYYNIIIINYIIIIIINYYNIIIINYIKNKYCSKILSVGI